MNISIAKLKEKHRQKYLSDYVMAASHVTAFDGRDYRPVRAVIARKGDRLDIIKSRLRVDYV